jgi:hypothetical protein
VVAYIIIALVGVLNVTEKVQLERGWLSDEGRKASQQFAERVQRERKIFLPDSSLPVNEESEKVESPHHLTQKPNQE